MTPRQSTKYQVPCLALAVNWQAWSAAPPAARDPVPRCGLVLELLLSVVAAWRPTWGTTLGHFVPRSPGPRPVQDCGSLTAPETL